MTSAGERVGLLTVRLYRPFDLDAFSSALPASTRAVAVLDRTKEPGAVGDPLYLDVVAALAETGRGDVAATGVRYGLSSKEFTPPMAEAVLADLAGATPRRHATVGIYDDVSGSSLRVESTWAEPESTVRAIFYGLGSDGTVGANKNSVKIIGTHTDLNAQGYFVYDSKKSGAVTVSHLRFGPDPIRSTYLIEQAQFVACHQFGLLEKLDVLEHACHGATFLLNSPYPAEEVWDRIPQETQQRIIDLDITVYTVDAARIAGEVGLGSRVNTVLQTCFFALSGVLPVDRAIAAIKAAIATAYAKLGDVVVERNHAAVDAALSGLHQVPVPATVTATRRLRPAVPPDVPAFVERVTGVILAGHGDRLPVSAFPVDGTFPTATARYEKRSIADEIPIWEADICIDCARCALVCPHAAIRFKVFDPSEVADAPAGFQTKPGKARDLGGLHLSVQVAPDDCTGCGVCVDICPAKSKEEAKLKAINMRPKADHLDVERANFDFFLSIPERDRTEIDVASVKGSQMLEPLFEFSGACAGCGETPYLKLLSQLFGDRIVVANATGCSSIYGANLPTTPWSADAKGRGPAWSNSLFEDNAEFGLGMRLALDQKKAAARRLVAAMADQLGPLAAEILDADQSGEAGIAAQRDRVEVLRSSLATMTGAGAGMLAGLADALVETGVWIVGGDGWAYDIGFGGLDHVLALGRNVNILVLDTEVYSNTGGQASKATPRAAVAKFAAGGKATGKKDLGLIAEAYGDVYVAQVAMGANMTQVVKAFTEAEAHPGASLIIAYSPCIAHGIDMSQQMRHQKAAAESGYWPLFRYNPAAMAAGEPPLRLDSRAPTLPFREFAATEARFSMLQRSNPEHAEELLTRAQRDIDDRWHLYEQMVHVERSAVYGVTDDAGEPSTEEPA